MKIKPVKFTNPTGEWPAEEVAKLAQYDNFAAFINDLAECIADWGHDTPICITVEQTRIPKQVIVYNVTHEGA